MTYSRQDINDDDINVVIESLKSPIITGGKTVEEFENAIANYADAKYAVTFSSGTAALHGAYFTAGIEAGDEFITTPMSFVATTNGGVYLGGKPIFVDINFDGNIDYKKIEEKISDKTKVITPIDFGGNPCEIQKIMEIGKKHNLLVIQDGAHSLGSSINNKKVGSIADMTTFSFHPVKPITTLEGGAVTTNSKALHQKLKKFRSHGIVKKELWNQDMESLGFNYRLSDVACALGLSQLNRLEEFIEKRETIATFYDKAFQEVEEISTVKIGKNKKSSRHLYPILLDRTLWCSKEDIFKELLAKDIGVQVHYKPVHKHSFYKNVTKEYLSNAEDFYRAELSIPCHQGMTQEEGKLVVESIKEVIKNVRSCNVR